MARVPAAGEAELVWTRNDGVTHINGLRRAELDRRFPCLLETILAASAE